MPISHNEKIDILPHKPGVYQFFNFQGEVIYVGKAKDLKKRIASYFNRISYDSAKLRILVSKIYDIKHIVVNTESDALLLENNLIKKLKPRYNILLKDDKTYPWICIKNESFPRVFSTRRIVQDGSKYYGPYTSGVLLKTILDLIHSLYPLRTCNLVLSKSNIQANKFKPCLEFQLGNCSAPCIGNQTEENYNYSINLIVEILKGNIHEVNKILKRKMAEAAKQFKYEEAQKYKVMLDALIRFQAKTTIVNPALSDIDVFSLINQPAFACVNYIKIIKGSIVQSHNLELKKGLDESDDELLGFSIAEIRNRMSSTAKEIIVPFIPEFKLDGCKYIVASRGEKFKLYELSLRNAKTFALESQRMNDGKEHQNRDLRILSSIQYDLKTQTLPTHIECFDNSNLQGTNPVASCVVFRNARPAKREYRNFIIKTVVGPNDFASMYEVVYRRYKRMIEENEELPQLIVIDGGKGQLSSAYSALKELQIEPKVQIIGIAKRLEEIFFATDNVPIYLDKNSETLKIIQQIRNEAHRFGITHHRNRRSKLTTQSSLEQIPGVGEKTIQIIFKSLKNLEAIKNEPLQELEKIIDRKKAKIIFNFFNDLSDKK